MSALPKLPRLTPTALSLLHLLFVSRRRLGVVVQHSQIAAGVALARRGLAVDLGYRTVRATNSRELARLRHFKITPEGRRVHRAIDAMWAASAGGGR